ncbi:MAG: substrate-binding domain-containing protein [Planctomycetes bacterium]|nr:substrate-binding domain-containing protein [Planctomycetota bacterium]
MHPARALCCVLLLLAGCSKSAPDGASAKPVYAVIPKGTTHVYWKAVERGAKAAGAELGVEIAWKGPLQEDDRAQQIQLVQQFTAQHVAGIALAPLDHTALVAPVRAAREAGIPVVIYDSGLDGTPGTDFLAYIATDNVKGGSIGGEELARLLPEGGDVVLLRYLVGSASTAQREQGFLDAIGKHTTLHCSVDNRYAGATGGEAKTAALNLMGELRKCKGVFCSNESATYGMLLALRQEGLAGKIRFVGFDSSPPLVEALKNGEIDALIVQDPRRMGALAVQTLEAQRTGGKVETTIDTGVVLVTREKLSDPAVQKLLE